MLKQSIQIRTTCVHRTLYLPVLIVSQVIDDATRTAISRVANIIRILATRFIPLSDSILLQAYEWTIEQDHQVPDLLQEDFGDALVASVTNL